MILMIVKRKSHLHQYLCIIVLDVLLMHLWYVLSYPWPLFAVVNACG